MKAKIGFVPEAVKRNISPIQVMITDIIMMKIWIGLILVFAIYNSSSKYNNKNAALHRGVRHKFILPV
jgi:hypothetical protein